MFVGSDVAAFIPHTRNAIELRQAQAVVLTADGYPAHRLRRQRRPGPGAYREFHIDWDLAAAEKGGYEYFMLKEIAEQPAAVADTLLGHSSTAASCSTSSGCPIRNCARVDKVFVVACGSPAYHSGLLAKYAIEHWCGCRWKWSWPANSVYRDPVLDRSTLVVAISQSGETADTLEAVRHAKEQKAKVLAICNTTAARSRANATPCSTPAPDRRSASPPRRRSWPRSPPTTWSAWRWRRPPAHQIPRRGRAGNTTSWKPCRTWWRGCWRRSNRWPRWPSGSPSRRPCCSWAATSATRWRWKARSNSRLAYMHAEGFAAGELKHGPIALIEDDLPVIVIMCRRPKGRPCCTPSCCPTSREIQARGAITIVIAEEGDDTVRPYADHLIEIPSVSTLLQPLLSTIPLQVFAASVAQARGYDVDKPRKPGQVRHCGIAGNGFARISRASAVDRLHCPGTAFRRQ
ncbi:hypothetical protein DKM27_25770 [Mycobacterium tuberculosis variant bovis]|nr:hypothetical protein DKM27_25770 [Mycobacterium tuberculosis variant bovis]